MREKKGSGRAWEESGKAGRRNRGGWGACAKSLQCSDEVAFHPLG